MQVVRAGMATSSPKDTGTTALSTVLFNDGAVRAVLQDRMRSQACGPVVLQAIA